MKILKYKKTVFGLSILFIFLAISFMYPLFGPKDFNKVQFLYDEKGNFLGVPPFPPSSHYLLGSDRNGEDILFMLVYGAKFTLLISFGVTFFRIFLGGLLGILFSLWLKRFLPVVKDFLLVFRLVPPIIITLPLMYQVWSTPSEKLIYPVFLYQMIVLVMVGIPSIMLMTAEIIQKLKEESFIQTSYLMGASHFHVLKTQFKPFLKSYGLLMGAQQLINTLTLIMFLGAFGMFIGGITNEPATALGSPNSLTKEWAGLIGQNYQEFYSAPWIVMSPLICYFIVILIINMIRKELETLMDINVLGFDFKKNRAKKKQKEAGHKKAPNSSSDFTFQRERPSKKYWI